MSEWINQAVWYKHKHKENQNQDRGGLQMD